ncbi:hypothetical protein EDD16DRAFT_1673308 [Pisolithus croceorrhizus]|nr:hypothetical protein EDD16DRAFT_1673308 [Pisolithus croceorrhizus]KAI6117619.1 hypothetical protein EV401DRAFT_1863352 [Pisolithus croceorrhizus]
MLATSPFRFRYCGRTAILKRPLTKAAVETDAYGIPLNPTWSVNELLSSYPMPILSSTTFRRLHELSALIPPTEGTPEHDEMKRELEELVRLVEAVKLVKLEDCPGNTIADGRIWAEGKGIPLDNDSSGDDDGVQGRDLLSLASRTLNGMYVVEANSRG